MLNSDKLCFENIVRQTRSSEKKFREGNFKGAIEDKREVRNLLNSKFCDEDIFCLLYTSPSPRDRTSSRMPSSA